MRMKLYTASGMPEAMALIRDELGIDAVILSSRRIAGGVEVTAALEEPEADPAPLPQFPTREMPREAPREAPRATAPVVHDTCPLIRHGTPEPLARKLRNGPLPFALSVVLRFQPLDAVARPLLFVGPPGAGKTLTVARLATRMVLAGRKPEVMNADDRRAGAHEQLAAFTDLLGLTLHHRGATVPRGAPLLIDSAGLDPFDAGDREEIQALASATDALTVLVLPGGIDAGEASDLAEAFADCGASRLVATRLDIARRLGGILAAAAILPLAEAGIGPSAADGLMPMTPDLLAACLQRRGAAPTRRSAP